MRGILVLLPAEKGMNIFQYVSLFKSISMNREYILFDFHGSGEFIGSEYNAIGFLSTRIIGNNQMLSDVDAYLNEICNNCSSFKTIDEIYLTSDARVKIIHFDKLIKVPGFLTRR